MVPSDASPGDNKIKYNVKEPETVKADILEQS